MTRRIVVVGAGLTGLAVAQGLAEAGLDVEVVEAAARAGGAIATARDRGYLVESGPHAYLDRPAIARLVESAGLARERREVRDGLAFMLARRGTLLAVPSTPAGLLASPILPLAAKARAIRAAKAARWSGGEESLRAWATRTFGEAVAPIADAAAVALFAGDAERLSVDHAFPPLRDLGRRGGDPLAYFASLRREARFVSLERGLGSLVEALAAITRVSLGEEVLALEKKQEVFSIATTKSTRKADGVVLAIPPGRAAAVLGAAWTPPREASIAVVALGYDAGDARRVQGHGYVASPSEGRFALGATFDSHLLPGRAPASRVLVRAFVGGVRHPGRARLDDATLRDEVHRDLASLGLVAGEPRFSRVVRPPPVPQIEIGHGALLAAARAAEARMPGLVVTGTGWRTLTPDGLAAEAEAATARVLAQA
ncbi:MAG TPA: protoporphyrinogen oxidase [Candidatus Thermoplasmatota archaeon]|nr:protoporphyrinogen oxidase [Candidatus Thermoplasmatota archaeon]